MNIYFAGGPASGKSSVMQLLKSCTISSSVFFVEECFSSILGKLPGEYRQRLTANNEDTNLLRQCLITATQVYVNQILFDTPYKNSRVVIQDRGIWDLDVYLEKDQAQVVRNAFLTPEALTASEGDLVLFFLLPEKPYDDPRVMSDRLENSFQEMKELEKRAITVWQQHSAPDRFKLIDANYSSVSSKARDVAGIINSYLEYPVFDVDKLPVS